MESYGQGQGAVKVVAEELAGGALEAVGIVADRVGHEPDEGADPLGDDVLRHMFPDSL